MQSRPRRGGRSILSRASRFTFPVRPRTIHFRAAFCAVLATLGVAHGRLSGQQTPAPARCDIGRISAIVVDNRQIYDVSEGTPLRWMYGLANALHITTKQGFILREILFAEGDCVDPLLLEESGRILRSYPFIGDANVTSVEQPDGTHHVMIWTQDDWTTKVDLGVSVDQGLQLERLDITEENLLGQGVLAAVYFRRRREQRDAGIEIQQPRLFGTRTDASFALGRTRVGSFIQETLEYPFVGEIGRVAMRQTYERRDKLFNYSTGDGDSITNALLPYEDEWAEVSMAARLGRPGNLTLFGFGVSRERVRFDGFPTDVEIAIDRDFGTTLPAPASIQDALTTQIGARSTTRLNLMFGQRNLRFLRPRGLDLMAGDQDVRVGTDVGLTVGRSIGALGISDLASPGDLFTRFRFFAGHDPGQSFIFLNTAVEGRRLTAGDDRWRDVIAEFDLYAYLRGAALPGQTIFVRASGSGGWSVDTPFQLTLGGREGVRSLLEERFPGARRMLFTIEDRVIFGWPRTDFMDTGITLFADAGKMWSGDVPYGVDTDWVGSVGIGLRMGFPAGGRGLMRVDLAFPVGLNEGRGPVFRVTMTELLGFIAGFEDDQTARARRSRVGPDLFVTDIR